MVTMPQEALESRPEPESVLRNRTNKLPSPRRGYRVATLLIFLGIGVLLGFLVIQYTRPRAPGEVPTGVEMDRPGKMMGPMPGMDHGELPGTAQEANTGVLPGEITKA